MVAFTGNVEYPLLNRRRFRSRPPEGVLLDDDSRRPERSWDFSSCDYMGIVRSG